MQVQVQLANIIELVTREAHVNAKPATQGMRGQLLRPATLLPLLLAPPNRRRIPRACAFPLTLALVILRPHYVLCMYYNVHTETVHPLVLLVLFPNNGPGILARL